MIGIFKKKEHENINIRDKFNWIEGLENQRLELSGQDLEDRLLEIKSVHVFLKSKEGEKLISSEEPKNCYDLSSDAEKAKDDWGTMKPE